MERSTIEKSQCKEVSTRLLSANALAKRYKTFNKATINFIEISRFYWKRLANFWEINIVNNAACCKLSSDVYELSKHVSHVSSHALYFATKWLEGRFRQKISFFFFWSTSLIKNTISSHKTACAQNNISVK